MTWRNPNPKRWPSFVVGLVCGIIIYVLSKPLTGQEEPWDSFPYFIPTTFVAGIIAALPAPRYWWLAFIGVYAGLFAGIVIVSPSNIGWIPFGLFVDTLLLLWAPSAIGALIVYLVSRAMAKRRQKRVPTVAPASPID